MKVYMNGRLARRNEAYDGGVRDEEFNRLFRREAKVRISQILEGLEASASGVMDLQAGGQASHILTSVISFTNKRGRVETVDLDMSLDARPDMNDILGSCSLIIDNGTGSNPLGGGAGWSQVSDWFHENAAKSGRNESRRPRGRRVGGTRSRRRYEDRPSWVTAMMGGSAGRPEPRNNRELRVENNIGYCEDALREISRTADIEFYDNSSSVPGAVVFSVTGHSDKLGEVEFMVIANESDGHRVSDHRALEYSVQSLAGARGSEPFHVRFSELKEYLTRKYPK